AGRFVCDFSTTGPVERTVSEVALLDVLQPYFSYNVACICGIPSVTLEGTPADWQKLCAKVDLLTPFGLDWWLAELRPICDQFVSARRIAFLTAVVQCLPKGGHHHGPRQPARSAQRATLATLDPTLEQQRANGSSFLRPPSHHTTQLL